jgi:hypothetical protein
MFSLPSRTLLALLCACALSCSSQGSGDPANAPSGDAGTGDRVGCAKDPRVMTFASGLQAKTTGPLSAQIVNATPSPPQRAPGESGLNAWTVKLAMNGGPVPSDAAVTVKLLMPDHGHGSSIVPLITPNPDGTFAVTRLYLFMAGVWEISFLVNGTDPATFSICIE